MKRFSIALLAGLIIADAVQFGRTEDLSESAANDVEAPLIKADAPHILVKLQISDEQNGKREILSRPQIRTPSGQPASIQVSQDGQAGGVNAEILANVESELFASPSEAALRKQRNLYAGAPTNRAVPIRLRLSVAKGSTGPKILAQLRVGNGESTTVKVGSLEIQLTAIIIDEERATKTPAEMSREELRLLTTLQKRVSVEFQNTPLRDVIKELAKRAEANVVIDPRALDDEGLTGETQVTISADGLRLSTVLDQVLWPLRLDYVIADEVIKITNRTRARGEPVTVTYAVGDLIARLDNGKLVPDTDAEQSLVEQIVETLSPETWDRTGGRGSVRVFQATQSLVIRQVADVHDEIAELLSRLRSARKRADNAPLAEEKPTAIAKPAE